MKFRPIRGLWLALLLLLWLCVPSVGAGNETAGIVLKAPPRLGEFPATTFDERGKPVGRSRLSLLAEPDGLLHVDSDTGMDGGARNHAQAWLRRVDSGEGYVIARERSESTDDRGLSLGVMTIDHVERIARCAPPPGEPDRETVEVQLPEDERIVNVPLNLLFLPLVRGEVEQVDFQYFLCRGGARWMDFRARIAQNDRGPDDRKIVEVSYGPDLGALGSWLSRALIPKLSFWFEADAQGTYLAHRMPLFSKGPEVVVVRDGAATEPLFAP